MAFQVQRAKAPRYVGWGYTKLKNWRNCPRQHLEIDIEKKWPGEDNDNLEFGNAVHKAMELRLTKATSIPAHLQNSLKGDMEFWCQKKLLMGFHDATDFERATRGLFKVEQQLALGEDFQPCEWFDKRVNPWLRAKIDVCKVQGPVALLVDWKTGKVSDHEQDQLAISAAMVFAHHPQVQVVRSIYVWLKEGTDVTTTMDIARADMPEFWAKLLPEVNKYRADVAALNMPEKPSGLCRFCRVKACQYNPAQNGG